MALPAVVALTGAGVSVGSGVPTFRDAGGLWREFSAHDLATSEAFRCDPVLVWEFYDWRRQRIADCIPNAAHRVLANMDRRLPDFTLVTQNVDGLHGAAGSRRTLCLHGDIWRLRCTRCTHLCENRSTPLDPLPPVCPECGALLRPDVVWFGESLDGILLNKARRAFERAEIALVIGTSALVQPAAQLPSVTLAAGGRVYEFNTETTPLTPRATRSFIGACEETLPVWWTEFCGEHCLEERST